MIFLKIFLILQRLCVYYAKVPVLKPEGRTYNRNSLKNEFFPIMVIGRFSPENNVTLENVEPFFWRLGRVSLKTEFV